MTEIPSAAGARAGGDALRDELATLRPAKLVLATDVDLGQALRQARQSLGLDVEDIAQATHVRADWIDALERLDLKPLPARPFAIGYVRAYARALGLDQELVVARFRHEIPGSDAALRAPIGGGLGGGSRFKGLMRAAAVVVVGLGAWNLIVRLQAAPPRSASPITATRLPVAPPSGPAELGPPLPPPPEAGVPPPYETPGLAAATAASGPVASATVTARIAAEAEAPQPGAIVVAGSPFAAHGAIYGAARGRVVIQALRPLSLVARGAGGAVAFARELEAGEAWRAPDQAGLTADVDSPAAAEVYVDGRASGPLTQSLTAVETLGTPAKPPAGP